MPPARALEALAFAEALTRETAVLQAQFPDLADALGRACALVADGAVFVEESGREAMVRSSQGTTWYHVNGTCPCPASQYRTGACKHRLALRLYQRLGDRLTAEEERWPVDLEGSTLAAPEIPAQYIVSLHGKAFVRYAGLLAMAHEWCLASLTTKIEYHSETLVLASATATFADGRRFTEWADSTPENVPPQVRPHWIRMALTRAKARALRDALHIGMCTLEERGED